MRFQHSLQSAVSVSGVCVQICLYIFCYSSFGVFVFHFSLLFLRFYFILFCSFQFDSPVECSIQARNFKLDSMTHSSVVVWYLNTIEWNRGNGQFSLRSRRSCGKWENITTTTTKGEKTLVVDAFALFMFYKINRNVTR